MRHRPSLVSRCIVVVLLTAQPALATAQSGATIRVEGAWARRAPMMAGAHGQGPAGGTVANGAVYARIRNEGGAADALLSASSDAAHRVEIHETRSEGGVMSMHLLPRVDIPGGGALEMRPGGHHIMLLGLTRDLRPGDAVRLTLTFEKAGQVTVEAPVR
jgi:copper(I)-binding protein